MAIRWEHRGRGLGLVVVVKGVINSFVIIMTRKVSGKGVIGVYISSFNRIVSRHIHSERVRMSDDLCSITLASFIISNVASIQVRVQSCCNSSSSCFFSNSETAFETCKQRIKFVTVSYGRFLYTLNKSTILRYFH